MTKRYQECSSIEKLWRLRYYLILPFQFIYHQYFVPFKVIEDETGDVYNPRSKNLWKLLIGIAQGDMQWYYTMDEVKEKFKKYKEK